MSEIRVNILPAVAGMGPSRFGTQRKHDAETVIRLLEKRYGGGTLTDPQGFDIPPDPDDVLDAGEYVFTLSSATQGANTAGEATEALRSFAAAVWGYPHEVVDRWLDAPEGTLFLADEALGSTLYVREAYVALYEKLEAEQKRGFAHAVVSGNPGLGKSWFALYVLVRWLNNKIPVLWHRQKDMYLFKDGDVRLLSAEEAKRVLRSQVIPGLQYIADGASPLLPAPKVEQSFVAHSPDESKYKEYMKPPKHLASPLWMPFWEQDKLETLRAKCFEGMVTHEKMQQLMGKRGAVPRLVLDSAEDAGPDVRIRDAISQLRIDDLSYAAPGTSQATHRVVRVHPADWRKGDFTALELGFLSPWIERTVAEVLLSRMASNLMALMQLTQQSPNQLAGAMAANLLESVTIGILLKGGSFCVRICPSKGYTGAVAGKRLIPAPADSSSLSEAPLADSTSTEPPAPSSSSSSTQAPAGDTAEAIGSSITQAPSGDGNSDSASASSQASADTGGSALGLQGAAEASSEGTLLLPELTEWFFYGVDDLQQVPAGDRWLQPPAGFPAVDGIAIVDKTAYLIQITRNLQHDLSAGLLSVLARLPKNLSVRFVWALPADMWEQNTFNARDVPAIGSLPTSGMCAIQALADEGKQLVEDRMKACETQYNMAIPISVFQAEPRGPPPDQPPGLPQRPEQPKAALSMGDSMARHPTSAPPSFLPGSRARTQLHGLAWPRPVLPRARPLSASYTPAVRRSFL